MLDGDAATSPAAPAPAPAAGGVTSSSTMGLAKPPLPRKARTLGRNAKQREREFPDVDWDRALPHFAACVAQDLHELNARFVSENVIAFAAWKQLWHHSRMSAAFHVEFWESNPSNMHKAVLQQALDGLVSCIKERDGEFNAAADVAALVGCVFAVYCVYSVQPSSPKHKIDVDPHAWTALLTIDCVMSSSGAAFFPLAAREVRAMMRRLVVQENAFLRCLQGFGHSVRVQPRAAASLSAQATSRPIVSDRVSVASSSDEEVPVTQEKIAQLLLKSDRYRELVGRVRAAGIAAPTSGIRSRGRRQQTVAPASQLPHSLPPDANNSDREIARALSDYVAYKTNGDARTKDRAARAAAARDSDNSNILHLADFSEHNDSSIASAPLSPVPSPLASSPRRTRDGHDGGDNDAFLLELEAELHADITNDVVEQSPASKPRRLRKKRQGEHESIPSRRSEADSDGLAELEGELSQSVTIEGPRKRAARMTEKTPAAPLRRKCGRTSPPVTTATRKGTPTVKPTAVSLLVQAERILAPRAAKRVRSESMASNLSATGSWAVSSAADSNEIAALQAELDASLSLSDQRIAKTRTNSAIPEPIEAAQAESAPSSMRLPGDQAVAGSVRRRNSKRTPFVRVESSERRVEAPAKRQRRTRGSSVSSVVSDGSDLLAQLETELESSASHLAPTSSADRSVSRAPNVIGSQRAISVRRSSRLSSVASDTESDEIAELMAELSASVVPLAPARSVPVEAKKTPRARATMAVKRPGRRVATTQRKTRASGPNEKDGEAPLADGRAHTTSRALAAPAQSSALARSQIVSSTPRVATRRSSRLSSVDSDTESNGLARLEAELNTSVGPLAARGPPKSSLVEAAITAKKSQKQVPPAKAADWNRTRWNAKGTNLNEDDQGNVPADGEHDVPAAVATPAAPTRSRFARPGASPLVPVSGIRRSSRLSSVASDTESDGLAELMAELNASVAPVTPAPVEAKKAPRKRATAAVKRPARRVAATRRESRASMLNEGVGQILPEAGAAPTQSSAVASSRVLVPARRPVTRGSSRLSSVEFDTESDGLAELAAESALAAAPLGQTPLPSPTAPKSPPTRVRADPKRPVRRVVMPRRQTRRRTDTTEEEGKAPVAASSRAARALRVARKPHATEGTQPSRSRTALRSQVTVPTRPLSTRRLTRSSSVASESESDGLAELEKELQAGAS